MYTDIQIQATEDGSATLYVPSLLETYHSSKGAIGESLHVYIQNGLLPMLTLKSHLHVLEVGFGTGLNVLLSIQSILPGQFVSMQSLEPFLLPENILLNYFESFSIKPQSLHCLPKMLKVGGIQRLQDNFEFELLNVGLESYNTSNLMHQAPIDLVYYDAFAPSKQPNMWGLQHFSLLYDLMSSNARLVTYCAQGQFKRDLKKVGFEVMNPPGAFGKREMTVAIKP